MLLLRREPRLGRKIEHFEARLCFSKRLRGEGLGWWCFIGVFILGRLVFVRVVYFIWKTFGYRTLNFSLVLVLVLFALLSLAQIIHREWYAKLVSSGRTQS